MFLRNMKFTDGRTGRIDLVARRGKFRVALEYDHHSLIKWKSFQKIVQIRPEVAIGITGNGNRKPNFDRAIKYINKNATPQYIISLKEKQYELLKPKLSYKIA